MNRAAFVGRARIFTVEFLWFCARRCQVRSRPLLPWAESRQWREQPSRASIRDSNVDSPTAIPDARIMLVGGGRRAPTKTVSASPYLGVSGQLRDRMPATSGLDPQHRLHHQRDLLSAGPAFEARDARFAPMDLVCDQTVTISCANSAAITRS